MIICRSRVFALIAAFGLSGCLDTAELGFASLDTLGSARPPASAKALSEAQLSGGDLSLTAPQGWCIEPRSLRNGARRSFALLAGCNELTDGAVGSESPRGYVTISVGPQDGARNGSAEVLDGVLAGSKALQRDVTAGVSRGRLAAPTGGAGPVWRAVAIAAGRPVLVTAHAPEGGTLAGPFGGRMVQDVVAALAANAVVKDLAQN